MIVDARGHRCPVPTLRLRRAIASAPAATRVTLLATDAMARIDVPFLMAEIGGRILSIDDAEGVLSIIVETPGGPTG